MKKDFLVTSILKVFEIPVTAKNHNMLFSLLYNCIPAFIFAPYLIYVGVQHDLLLLLLMGTLLFLVDTMHFVKAIFVKKDNSKHLR